MKVLFLILSFLSVHNAGTAAGQQDTVTVLQEAGIVADLKQPGSLRNLPVSFTSIPMSRIESENIESTKDISAVVPNFFQPDYGSRMTSSIYVRGFGSRMDQPVVGLNVDGIPYMNKNGFDFDFFDIRKLEILRGPQGTLYGRNTSGGLINITTLSPFVWQGFRGRIQYAFGNSFDAKASYYGLKNDRFGYSVSVSYRHDAGDVKNEYTGRYADWGDDFGLRNRFEWKDRRGWNYDNTIYLAFTNQGGYAYRRYLPEEGVCEPLNYNDYCGYQRAFISEGFKAGKTFEKIRISTITGVNYLSDKMTLDQDFTTRDLFTLDQLQRELNLSQDVVIRNNSEGKIWDWLCGAFVFGKFQNISAPVNFHQEGVDDLILGTANAAIKKVFPAGKIEFEEPGFTIESDFTIPTFGAALYHESKWRTGNWTFTAGLRLDYETTKMDYCSSSLVNYRFNMMMKDFKPLPTVFEGTEDLSFLRLLPKIGVSFNKDWGELYFTATRGYRAGGFNTNIFSDILQVNMKNNLMNEFGMGGKGGTSSYESAGVTCYKPEENWNFEIGGHLSPAEGLSIDFSAFYILCQNQQVTVLPKGNNTGRMMSNAARSHSLGGEVSLNYVYRGLDIRAAWGHTDAVFDVYEDASGDYSGNYLPYAPQNTLSGALAYTWTIPAGGLKKISAGADYNGIGRIYWDEMNSLYQPFYSLLGAHLTFGFGKVNVTFWGKNILNTEYDTFYFSSVSQPFFSKGRPARYGLKVDLVF